jgi:hypothetical protein
MSIFCRPACLATAWMRRASRSSGRRLALSISIACPLGETTSVDAPPSASIQ